MKYKVGDIVKLRDDLDLYINYGYGWQCNSSMLELKGQKVTITTVWENYYDIAEDDGKWGWTDNMIEGLWEECNLVNSSVKKYKLIDILNKIANGELKEGTVVVWDDVEYPYKNKCLYGADGEKLFYWINTGDLNDEVELIEPQEPKECEHKWELTQIKGGNLNALYYSCGKCGIRKPDADKMVEPTDNTAEKIEELDKEEMLCLTLQCDITVLTDKLNEVIRKVNKEDNNE